MNVHNEKARSARALSWHRFLIRFTLASGNMFAWVFVFHFYYIVEQNATRALGETALLYALSSLVAALVTPIAARAVRSGTKRILVAATMVAMSAFAALGAALSGSLSTDLLHFSVIYFALALGIYRALYFVPYEVEVSDARVTRSRREDVVIALSPALAGILIVVLPSAPFYILMLIALGIACSIVPLFALHDMREKFIWTYRETFHQLVAPEHRKLSLQSFMEGVVGAALLFFWPLSIFFLLDWSYPMLGIVLSLTFLIALFLRNPVRQFIRRSRFYSSRLFNSILATSPWLLRLTVAGPLSVLLVDSYFYTTTPRRGAIDPFVFEQVSDGGSLIDEFTALKEISLSLGRCLAAIAVGFLALASSVPLALIGACLIAGIASLVISLRS